MRAILLALLFIPAAAGQGIFMTDEMTGTTNAGNTSYTMVAPLPPEADTKAYTATGFGALAYTTDFNYAVSSAFTPTGDVSATAFLSCDTQTILRPGAAGELTTARMEFVKDGTIADTVNLESLRTCDGPEDIWEAVFTTSAFAGTTFGAGSTFTLNLLVWTPTGNPGSGVENMYVLIGPSFPSGAIGDGLPAPSVESTPEPIVVHANITDGFEHSWATPRDATHLFNFTSEGDQELAINVSASQGQATLKILDGEGASLYDGSLENHTSTLVGAPGNWSLSVVYDDYVGDVSLRLSPVSTEGEGEGESSTQTQTATGTSSATSDDSATQTQDESESAIEDKESPGLPLIGLVAAILLARRFK